MDEITEAKIRKNNMRLYPIYNMVGLDLMFFYAIQLLFATQVKGFSASSAVLLGSFYAIFAICLNIPLAVVVQKIGKRNSMVLGNIFNLVYFLMWIFCTEYYLFILAEFFSAVAFGLKGITENTFLNESIPKAEKKREIFTKISSNGYSKFAYFSAFAMLISGFLYDINPYMPLICGAICVAISAMISANFIDIEKFSDEKEETSVSEMFEGLKSGLKFIFESERLKALLIMVALIWGIICVVSSYRTALLESIECSATFIGALAAFLEIMKGVGSTKANDLNKKLKNNSLTIIMLIMSIAMVVSGAIALINTSFMLQISVIVLAFTLFYTVKGTYQILSNRYKNSFTTPKLLTQIYSVDAILSNIARMVATFIASGILAVTDIKWSMIIMGIIFAITGILFSKYMKSRVGLNPEEYNKQDIKFEG